MGTATGYKKNVLSCIRVFFVREMSALGTSEPVVSTSSTG
jgi:hypothetical protein